MAIVYDYKIQNIASVDRSDAITSFYYLIIFLMAVAVAVAV